LIRSPSLWDGCFNARDTGGLPAGEGVTRSGVLFRSDNLCRLTEAGLHGFAASGVETVIDVRSAYELGIDPSPFAASNTVRYLNLPLQNEDDAAAMAQINSDIALPDMYRVMLRHFGANIRAIVEAVAEADGAVVIHCHAGKDRTGLVIALLLSAVGVADDTVAEDYAASQHYLREAAEQLASAKPEERAGLERHLGAEAETMLSTLDWLQAEYGGAEAYLLQSGVPERVIARLRERLVAI
jgi:protein-tyrosine phosphatase